MGYCDSKLTSQEKNRIARAACRVVAYDRGFAKTLAWRSLQQWHESLQQGIRMLMTSTKALAPSHHGSTSAVAKIETAHPGYLSELFRYATKTLGAQATFLDLAYCMNRKSQVPTEERSVVSLSDRQLAAWFKNCGGKLKPAVVRPLLKDEMKQKRLEWIETYGKLLTDPECPVAFLDEKWFWIWNGRRWLKWLPRQVFEAEGANHIATRKALSRRHQPKVMFMGVVGRPNPKKGFDGKIFLRRFSKNQNVKRRVAHQKFANDLRLNNLVRDGDWKILFLSGMTVAELRAVVVDFYDLEDEVSNHLQFCYRTFVGQKGNEKIIYLGADEVIGAQELRLDPILNEKATLTIENVEMNVCLEKGDETEEDINCDSSFMLEHADEIGEAIREAFHWVMPNVPVYLVMHNAGGHGTKEAVASYTELLKIIYNIEIIHQVPSSPETNVLDLGIWNSLQWEVDRVMHGLRNDTDSLASAVEEVWENKDCVILFENVWNRLGKVMHLIKKDNGGHELVETERGKLYQGLDHVLAEELGETLEEGVPMGAVVDPDIALD